MSDSHLDLSLVIACYNEEPVMEASVETILEVLDNTRFSYEIIFVDDCSQDRTRELIDAIISKYPDRQMSRLFHEQNKGRGGTVTDGIRQARGEVVGFIDVDLEIHAHYVPSCVLTVQNGADIASAYRVYRLYLRSLNRHVLSRGYAWLVRKLLQVELGDTEAGCKFFKREKILPVLDEVEDQRWFWDTEVMVRSYLRGYKIVEIPCLFTRRFDKVSTVHPVADTIDYFKKLWRFRKTVRNEMER
jgi:glycosyltransferase involved in cell wall biosynthesis